MSHCQALPAGHPVGHHRHLTFWCMTCEAKLAILLPVGVPELEKVATAFADLHIDCAPMEAREPEGVS